MENETIKNLLNVLIDRNGFDNWWYNIDEETQEEIMEELEMVLNESNDIK